MTPQYLGFPPSFASFRPAQEEAIEFCLTTAKRFCAIGAPPGCGKSGIAFALAKLLGGRTVILTANLGLQAQYVKEFGRAGLVSIEGRANYPCWEGGTCEDGARLDCRQKESCPYMGAFRLQNASDIVVTNYAYWLAVHEKSMGLREADTLICDEAGLASEWLSRALDFEITERQCRAADYKIDRGMGEDFVDWRRIAPELITLAERRYVQLKAKGKSAANDLKKAERFLDSARKLLKIDPDNWVITKDEGTDEGRRWRFEAIWPGMYREKLFRGIERIILLSATLRPKTLSLLGIPRNDCDFREWGRQFPAANGPVVWLDRVRVNHRMSGEDRLEWLKIHRYCIDLHDDRRGLIHTVSYARAKEIAAYLSSRRINLNGAADPETQTARQAFNKHIAGPVDSILCSPSFSTGWDFKYKAAEFQIISKIPTKDMRSKIMQARRERDPGYEDYLAGQDFVQACGRVQRDYDDMGMTVLPDSSWKWFQHKAGEHIPRWFRVRRETELPPALPLL